MSIFKKHNTEGLEQVEDRLGGGSVLEAGAYLFEVVMAYAGKSDSGSEFIDFEFKGVEESESATYKERIYFTNKKGENYFVDQKSNKKVGLPGFVVVDHICLVTSGQPLSEQDTEEKMVKVYNFEKREDEYISAPVLTDVIGKQVRLGLQKILKNKQEKGDNGYYDVAGERTENSISKVFVADDKRTVSEVTNGVEEAEFYDKWVEKNAGQTIDRRTIKDGQAPAAGAPRSGGTRAAGEKPSLFGKK